MSISAPRWISRWHVAGYDVTKSTLNISVINVLIENKYLAIFLF